MTVGELKTQLENVPDDWEVTRYDPTSEFTKTAYVETKKLFEFPSAKEVCVY